LTSFDLGAIERWFTKDTIYMDWQGWTCISQNT